MKAVYTKCDVYDEDNNLMGVVKLFDDETVEVEPSPDGCYIFSLSSWKEYSEAVEKVIEKMLNSVSAE